MILVTGGTGLLGAQLLFDLAKAGKKVRALKRATSGDTVLKMVFYDQPDLLEKIEWVTGDTTEVYSVLEAMQGVEEVYHCAAKVSFLPGERQAIMKINSGGTANVVNMALETGVKKFCHVSSVAALGRVDENKVIDESTTWKASKYNSYYAISKYGGEREVWRGMEEGLNAIIVNPSIITGPGDWKSGSSAMFKQLWKGIKFYPEGMNGFVDVADVTRSMIQLMEKKVFRERFIINSENLTYHTVFDLIADSLRKPRSSIRVGRLMSEFGWRLEYFRSLLVNSKPFITRETARSSQRRWKYSNEKIKNVTGMEFMPVSESVRRTAEIFLRQVKSALPS